jgi:glycosyltransferase involved in cell wall biosynthesis
MKVLIIGFWFPPANVVGAIRLGKLARFLDHRGHDVRVLTSDVGDDRSLPLEVMEDRVLYTEYPNQSRWLEHLVRAFSKRVAERLPAAGNEPVLNSAARLSPLRNFIQRQYYGLLHFPDMRTAWLQAAIPAGTRLISKWRPDIIFASAPPFTGFRVASRLARAFGIPWVADFRDLWVDNPYYNAPIWRWPADAALEWLTLRSAALLVTVSPLWAGQLRRRHHKPTEVVYNGYAEEDFPRFTPQAERGEVVTIRYMGSIYPGFRDPSPLFAAISLLPASHRGRINVEFYCDAGDTVVSAAAAHRVESSVTVRTRVSYSRALELQMQADILLLLQSTEQRDEGNLPAKLFEYLYARRPILFIGYEHGIGARLVRDRGAGLVSNAPMQIRDQLQTWLADKQAGRLRTLEQSVSRGLSRNEQFHKLEQLFSEITTSTVTPPLRRGQETR